MPLSKENRRFAESAASSLDTYLCSQHLFRVENLDSFDKAPARQDPWKGLNYCAQALCREWLALIRTTPNVKPDLILA